MRSSIYVLIGSLLLNACGGSDGKEKQGQPSVPPPPKNDRKNDIDPKPDNKNDTVPKKDVPNTGGVALDNPKPERPPVVAPRDTYPEVFPSEDLGFPKYQPITNAFANPQEIMSCPDLTNTLLRLRQIASPTGKYHQELESLLDSVETTDVAHVKMLMDAVYFRYSKYEAILRDLEALKEAEVPYSMVNRKLEMEKSIAENLSRTLAYLANIGLPKSHDVNWAKGISVLERLYPNGGASISYKALLAQTESLNPEKKNQLMLLASSKREIEVASDLAIDLFKTTTDKSLSHLLDLVDQLKGLARDKTLIKASPLFSQLTHDEIMQMLARQTSKDGSIASAFYPKSREKTHKSVIAIAETLDEIGKDNFIKSSLPFYNKFSSEQVYQLCKIARSGCAQVTKETVDKWQDPTIAHALDIAAMLSYNDKDNWTLGVIKYFPSITGEQAISFIQPLYDKKYEIAEKLVTKISNMTPAHVIKIAGFLYSTNIDLWVDSALAQIPKLSSEDFYLVLKSVYSDKIKIALKYVSRVEDLLPKMIVKISSNLFYSTEDKDSWIAAAAPQITQITVDELIQVMNSGYKKLNIAESFILKIKNLDANGALKIANTGFYDEDKYKWLGIAIEQIKSLTANEIIKVLENSYKEKGALSLAMIPKASDLTVKNAIRISGFLYNEDRDSFLLEAVDKLRDLTKSNKESYIQASFNNNVEIRKKVEKRLAM